MPASRRQPAKSTPASSAEKPDSQVPATPISAAATTDPPLTVSDRPRAVIPTSDPDAGEQTAVVRPMTFDDIIELAQRGGQIDVYRVETRGGTDQTALCPAVLTVNEPVRPGNPVGRPVYPVDARGRSDQTQPPLGLAVGVSIRSMFGTEQGGTLHTTQAAEHRASGEFLTDRASLRARLALPADDGVTVPLVPVYGSTVNVTAFVKGIDPTDALRVVEEALAAAFPAQAHLTLRKSQSRAVEDYRVNVFSTSGEVIGIDVLDAEASYVAGRSAFRTEAVPAGVVRGNR